MIPIESCADRHELNGHDPFAAQCLTISAVAELAYCPRSFWYEVVNGQRKARNEIVEQAFIEDQNRLDRDLRPKGARVTRHFGVFLFDRELGLRGQVDVIEEVEVESSLQTEDVEKDCDFIPVEYRHGQSPGTETDVMAMTLMAIILERLHHRLVKQAKVFFVADRTYRTIVIDTQLKEKALSLLARARRLLEVGTAPENVLAPICKGCSWFNICSPDLKHWTTNKQKIKVLPRRRFDRVLYVEESGVKLRLKAQSLTVMKDGEVLQNLGLETIDQVVLVGKSTHITTPAIRQLATMGIDLVFLAWNGRMQARIVSNQYRNPVLQRSQHRRSSDLVFRLEIAKAIVSAKIHNQRVNLLRLRRRVEGVDIDVALRQMEQSSRLGVSRPTLDQLRGDEGMAARFYFQSLAKLLNARGIPFSGRKRRPPPDPVNVLLSFAYSLLAKDVEAAIQVVGLNPCFGFYHSEHYGRPALALDLMEEFRPVIADSVVMTLLNKNMIQEKHFKERVTGIVLNQEGRKKFYRAWERRMNDQLSHPLFETKYSLRRTIELQCRLLTKVLEGDVERYLPLKVR